jgi:hypothetical protein
MLRPRALPFAHSGDVAGGLRRLGACLAGLLLLALPGHASGHSFVEKSFRQLVVEADHIFLGTVTEISSTRLPSGAIVSHVTLVDLSGVKGDAPPTVLTVLGGTVDGQRMRVAGIPEFQVGHRYLLFERGNGRDAFPFVGGPQGVFKVDADARGRAVVLDAFGLEILVDERFDPSLRTAVPLTLEMFLRAIRDVRTTGP